MIQDGEVCTASRYELDGTEFEPWWVKMII